MPTVNIGQLVAASFNRVVTDKPEDQVFGDRWLFDQFTVKNGGLKKLDGGEQIEVSIQYGTNTTFRSFSDMEPIDVQRIDVFEAAQYAWKEHGGSVTYSILQEFKNGGESRKFELIAGLVQNAIESHKNDLTAAMYGSVSTNSKNINGLLDLVPDDPTTGVSGNINRATFSFWRSNAKEDTGSSFSTLRANMRTVYNDCSDGAFSNHPTTIVTDQASFEGYEGLLTANERNTSKSEGDAGYKNEVLKFKGAKIAYDENCSAGRMYFLNPQYIHLYVAKGIFMKLGKELEPVNQFSRTRKIHTIAQFVVRQPRRLGVLYSIA